jgi:hypothetical protein
MSVRKGTVRRALTGNYQPWWCPCEVPVDTPKVHAAGLSTT